jgi:hypothetical protein
MAGYSAGFSIAGSSAVLHDPRNDAALKQGAVTLIVPRWPRLAGAQTVQSLPVPNRMMRGACGRSTRAPRSVLNQVLKFPVSYRRQLFDRVKHNSSVKFRMHTEIGVY